ncbi:aminotransferase class IV [Stenotrophomonas sp. HITSZ_GD]|uniref:aminotransferase class IV n=1 Tax=Stenotrophomonas sp. HITSZ_GD TaxID=3037248 RepID=UPI00240D7597|nr:aminotransferase class IV [Stenotrophomonas sp. HITSZ_GD]MDG2524994.1 aminotransferase class IV [Stenotrophomonas sp. HITSZ_GD]
MTAAWCNGQPADADVLAAVALVNYGHFTSMRCLDGAVRGLDLHLARLQHATRALFSTDLDLDHVRRQARLAFDAAGHRDAWLRLTVFSRAFDFRAPLAPVAPDLLVSVGPASEWTGAPLRLHAVVFRRHRPEIKHVGTFALFDLRRQAMAAGWDDALFVDDARQLIEGTTWNLGLWDGQGVTWPVGPALRGTQERLLQRGLEALGVPQRIRPVGLDELAGFAGAFACNARGIRAVGAVEGHRFTDGAGGQPWLAQALAACPWQPL